MRTKAVRLYGADDLRLEEFDLPDIADDEILVRVITDSICMSTYKLLKHSGLQFPYGKSCVFFES